MNTILIVAVVAIGGFLVYRQMQNKKGGKNKMGDKESAPKK